MQSSLGRRPFFARSPQDAAEGALTSFCQFGIGLLTLTDAVSLRSVSRSCRTTVSETSYGVLAPLLIALGPGFAGRHTSALASFPFARSVTLKCPEDPRDDAEQVLRVAEFTGLRTLALKSVSCLQDLAGALSTLSSLEALTVYGGVSTTLSAAAPLRAQPGKLASLYSLTFTDIDRAGSEALLTSCFAGVAALMLAAPELRQLAVACDGSDAPDAPTFAALADALLGVPRLSKLALHCTLSDPSVVALAAALPRLPLLSELEVVYGPIHSESVLGEDALRELLSSCRQLPRLQKLTLDGSYLDLPDAVLLGDSLGFLPGLTLLDLRGSAGYDGIFYDERAEAIASGLRVLPLLESIVFANNGIGSRGIAALIGAISVLPRLTFANFCFNPVGDDGIAAILGCPPCVTGIGTALNIAFSDIRDRGALLVASAMRTMFKPLAAHAGTKCLTSLNMSGNDDVGDDGVVAIATALAALDLSELTSVDAIDALLTQRSCEALVIALASQPLPALTSVQIDGCITPDVLPALGLIIQRAPRLQHLRLGPMSSAVMITMVNQLIAAAGSRIPRVTGRIY